MGAEQSLKPTLLVLVPLDPPELAALGRHFTVLHAADAERRQSLFAAPPEDVRAVLTSARVGLSAEQMHVLPALSVIAALGIGTDGIDVTAAQRRNIDIVNGRGTTEAIVADHAFALLLTAARGIGAFDRGLRTARAVQPRALVLHGKRLGILGLGEIGSIVARRAGGFDMIVGYHNRQPRDGVVFHYAPTLAALAEWADFLIVAAPLTPETHHLVDAEILRLLGPDGVLVNVGRGGIIDTPALVAALQRGDIASAALDVFEGEPDVPEAFRALENLVLTPHIAAMSPDTMGIAVAKAIDNIIASLACGSA